MSNDVIPAGRGPSQLFGTTPNEDPGEGLEGLGYPIIGVAGKNEFYIKYKGKKYTIVEPAQPRDPNDRTPPPPPRVSNYLDVVILRRGKNKSHTWYKNGYEPDSAKPPDCQSTDGDAPDDSVKPYDPETGLGRQSDNCHICPQHEWKMQERTGREGRACSDNLRTVVIPIGEQIRATLGHAISEPCYLRIPATSINSLVQMAKYMVDKYGPNSKLTSYFTRITFKAEAKYPVFEFKAIDFLGDEWARIALEQRNSPMTFRILGMDANGEYNTRRKMVQIASPQPVRQIAADPPPMDNGAVAARLAAERAERIAQVRAAPPPPPPPPSKLVPPRTIEATATEVIEPQVPLGPAAWEGDVPTSTDEIDAVVARMTPPPPRSS